MDKTFKKNKNRDYGSMMTTWALDKYQRDLPPFFGPGSMRGFPSWYGFQQVAGGRRA